ncbi:endosome-associated-trafficking regulator 1 isoform X3 [Sagmatias obliquidens]|uniref:endosome-associated-trafficking regulator 1 isoform X3 n=1 Tax=Sagmatias obliquidens TaxID=3371155 RepID=UPI000F4419A8|nr:endosome-associated-trafficking regulator 1 isoform X3 [Lagenorhynchus obliquidens]XP_026956020.1 endosome-associated-trafficking regulator 1 isoform X3 [Lagenorhynchus obliquidens]
MAGYARRPGVTPLSRARSLVIPDAPAFYERRSCLPQLDCERPQARDLESHFFGIRPTFMCYVPSPVLASVGDTDLGYGKGKGTMHGPSGAQNTHFGGEKLGDLEEANPFSFKEFLKSKNLGLSKEDTDSRIYSKEATRHSLGLGRSSPTSQAMGYGLEHQQPFFEDPTGAGDLLDEDEGWDGAYLPSAVEQTHSSRVAASTSPCSTYVSFFSNPSELVGPESLPPCMLSDSDSRVSPAGSPSTDFTVHGESLGDRHLRTLQISYEALKDENSKLRRKLTEVQSFSETQTEMVRTLERKLEAKMIKEESDYHDLESVVQQVEQNLERMTKRAVKAENHVLKLKQEISLLQPGKSPNAATPVPSPPPRAQAQVSNFKQENEALRSGQGASLAVVKQNTDVALQNLRVVMNNARASVKQLVSGAETLNLVAEILKSIDRISEIKDQGEES